MRRTLSDRQIVEWWQYHEAEPWGDARDDLRFEVLRRRLVEDECPLTPFFPYVDPERAKEDSESPAEFNARMRAKAEELMRARKA